MNTLPTLTRHLIGGIRGYVCCPAGRWCVSTDQAAACHGEHERESEEQG